MSGFSGAQTDVSKLAEPISLQMPGYTSSRSPCPCHPVASDHAQGPRQSPYRLTPIHQPARVGQGRGRPTSQPSTRPGGARHTSGQQESQPTPTLPGSDGTRSGTRLRCPHNPSTNAAFTGAGVSEGGGGLGRERMGCPQLLLSAQQPHAKVQAGLQACSQPR